MKVGALVHMYPPVHNAGAEHMLHAILSEMVCKGITCSVAVQPTPFHACPGEPYTIDGVQVGTRDVLAGCDVLLTHLDRTPEAESYALRNRLPLVQIMHNHHRTGMAKNCQLAVYNSHWLADQYPTRGCNHSIVVHPPVWPDTYRVTPSGDCVTLVNLSKPKGAMLFYELARAMPDVRFLGVRGAYGKQEEPPLLPNLEVIPTQTDMRTVYQRTRILLMPSAYESYGRCAIEAAASGIPTIANDTPGLRESLGAAGVFPERLEVNRWQRAIRQVMADWDAYSKPALALSDSLEPAFDVARLIDALEALPSTRLSISAAVMAHPSRTEWAEALGKTLGCSVVYDRGQGLWDTARRALQAFDPAASHHLVVQDDAIMTADLLSELGFAAAVCGNHPIALYVGGAGGHAPDVTKAFDEAVRCGASWVRAPGPWWAVGVAHPVALLPEVLRIADTLDIKADDARLTAAYQTLGTDCWYTVPCLVDHRDGPSIVREGKTATRKARLFAESAKQFDWYGQVILPGVRSRYSGPTVTYRHIRAMKLLTIPVGSHRVAKLDRHPQWELVP